MAEENVASLFQSPEEFDNILEILKQSIDEHDSSPTDSPPDTVGVSVSPSSESSVFSTDEEEVEEHYTNNEQACKEPQMEMSQYQLVANFGARRKPEMTFILSISDAISTYGFNEKCSIEINGDEVQTCYNYFKPRTANKTGYCVHARLYLRDEKGCYLLKTENPSPLSFVYSKDRVSAWKDGQLKLRLRENLTMKHLPVTDDKNPPQLLIQFTLTFENEKLLETEQLPISFTPSKKKRYAETTDIIFSPSKIPSSSITPLEPSTKRVKSEPIPQTIVQNQFPTASAIWSSTSPVDIINYLEAQMMSSQQQPPSHQFNTIIPTVYMLVPAGKTTPNQTNANPLIMTPFTSAPMLTPMVYAAAPPPKSPLKNSPRKYREVQPTEFYSNICISQPLGELLPTMMPKKMEPKTHVPIDPQQMECWLDSLSS